VADDDGDRVGEVLFERDPASYQHWNVAIEGAVATVTLLVEPTGTTFEGYELKLNSYDLDVDIELYDVTQRLRFEHPEVGAVILTGGLDRVFCAGANIQMLAAATHAHKVNFCKFTNETRLAIEDSSAASGLWWIAALNGTAAGGGYELALACNEIVLVDDRSTAVSLPEVPLLGVLPGTGGLTRLVEKRHVRRDLADLFSTRAEGMRGEPARAWGLVDSVAPPSGFAQHVRTRADTAVSRRSRPEDAAGVELTPLDCDKSDDALRYRYLAVELDRSIGVAHLRTAGPARGEPATADELVEAGDRSWLLGLCREFDDAVLHLRFNEPAIGTWVLHSDGDIDALVDAEEVLDRAPEHWLVREIRSYWKRTLKRFDVSARTLVALIESASCFAGTLAELVLGADRSFMFDGEDDDGPPPPSLVLTTGNDGAYPMGNGLSRLETRFLGHPAELAAVRDRIGKRLSAAECAELGLVTVTLDELDWDDEIRLALEERAAFSPDALTGLEANLRFAGPETMETKIFGRLSAWQNWIFLRPNASGPGGALRSYGTGSRPAYDRKRV
jgi:benzoyl-CoA-dihydrodiol lyase